VDDGKSTLIGRLLHDTKMIYEDQLAAVKKDSAKHGTTGTGEIDLALLTDGLRAEREQGITIDVAYRYFSTDKRKFIIADTPGHEQYTRNMATGASNCHLAIILIDARHGVATQTRRHSYICSLLGIKHIVVAINKMDLVGYSEEVFAGIQKNYELFAHKLGGSFNDITFIPMSALKGDNVAERSGVMKWYTGPCLLEHLETVSIAHDTNLVDFRLPVQLVLRPHLNFRGFAGTIASGTVKRGDAVKVLPSGRVSRVKSLVTFDGELEEAFAPMAVTVTLEDEVDISRGDMLVLNEAQVGGSGQPVVSADVEAMVVWMSDQPLVPGKAYWIKHTTRVATGSMVELKHGVDVNTLEEKAAAKLGLNEVGRVVLSVNQPLVFDAYGRNRATGGFIIVDRLTNNTMGAGMIVGAHGTGKHLKGRVSMQEKEFRLGQKGVVVWVRREIVDELERELFEEARTVVRVDVEELSAEAMREACALMAEQGLIVLLAGGETPDESLCMALGERLLVCADKTTEWPMELLRRRGIALHEDSTSGGGI